MSSAYPVLNNDGHTSTAALLFALLFFNLSLSCDVTNLKLTRAVASMQGGSFSLGSSISQASTDSSEGLGS